MVHKLGQKSLQTTQELLDIVTNYVLGDGAVGAIFNHCKQKNKRDKDPDGGFDGQPDKRKKRTCGSMAKC
jgi:hypothetical protein